ncbi:TraB/GumN family protein [Phenylobacterium montanum]|uniref:TraB/GumN family protein n=1 Tax=Phenylobacterium montanum TaxID=2823693 RepID=A0A975IUM2_9CAUL|nr:TraB/GumN family protein [Caulobacter sp. S6]QUD87674.1 TraB/GumN family protein [Caulobacter sp. S6]
MTRSRVFSALCAVMAGVFGLTLASAAGAAPAWWRVSDGRNEIWIIGAPRVTPRNFNWDTSGLEKRLASASTLIVGPQPKNKVAETGLILVNFGELRSPTPMETTLSPPLRRQFAAMRQSIGQGQGHYDGWKPAVAGFWLSQDFLKAYDLQSGQVESKVRKLAHAKGLSETPSGTVDASEMINQFKTLGAKGQEACLAASVHDLSVGPDRLKALADAWAKGEVTTPPIDAIDRACLQAAPAFGAAFDRAANQDSAAIAQALSRGAPRAVAEFDLPTLIMPGGVLDHLRARGLQVSGPME